MAQQDGTARQDGTAQRQGPADIDGEVVEEVITDVLGDAAMRPGQEEAIEAALERDTLAVLATGTGKTAIYQVVAQVLPGPTVVVSPTIALQVDQVNALVERGGSARLLNGLRTPEQQARALEEVRAGEVEFLLLAPEQLAKESVVALLAEAGVSLVVVDEAHCVSEWGHDFRPDYLALASVVERLGHPRVLALTATASPRIRQELVERLGMVDPAVVVRGADRPNIWLGVSLHDDEDAKTGALVGAVTSAARDGAGIVYAATRKGVEDLAECLRAEGLAAVAYHGSLRKSVREEAQRAFMAGEVQVMVATNAFGMGIDKADVRFVFHLQPPDSVDAYYQEVGRAGRDGEPARAVLFYRSQDLGIRTFFSSRSGPSGADVRKVLYVLRTAGPHARKELAAAVGVSERRCLSVLTSLSAVGAVARDADGDDGLYSVLGERSVDDVLEATAADAERQQRFEASRVEMMRTYAETTDCRRRVVLELLGEEHGERCGHCDNCDRGWSTDVEEQPYRVGETVRHAEWGSGLVHHLEEDKVTVLFDEVGYRTLAVPLVEEKGLLTHG